MKKPEIFEYLSTEALAYLAVWFCALFAIAATVWRQAYRLLEENYRFDQRGGRYLIVCLFIFAEMAAIALVRDVDFPDMWLNITILLVAVGVVILFMASGTVCVLLGWVYKRILRFFSHPLLLRG